MDNKSKASDYWDSLTPEERIGILKEFDLSLKTHVLVTQSFSFQLEDFKDDFVYEYTKRNETLLDIIKDLNYEIVSDDGQYLKAISIHKYPISIKGKRILSLNRSNRAELRTFVGIKEDGGTRTVFNGFIEKPADLRLIDKLTSVL